MMLVTGVRQLMFGNSSDVALFTARNFARRLPAGELFCSKFGHLLLIINSAENLFLKTKVRHDRGN